jgi:hypothetical protein
MSTRHVRSLQAGSDDLFGRLTDLPPDATASFLGQVTVVTALPTTTGRFVLVHPVEIDGDQAEGDAPSFSADATRTIPVVVLGVKVPAVGDFLTCFAVGGKWVAETGCGSSGDVSCPGGGTLCVSLTSVCAGNNNGYTVVVKDHATGTVVATGTTTSGSVCFSGLTPGGYDVTATKSGCSGASWINQPVVCAETTTLTGVARCATNDAVVFTVKGCHNHLLPDAVIAITGADSGTVTTDGSGVATFYTDFTGSFSFTITHPSGRFTTVTGSFTKLTVCASVAVGRTMSAATGYNCCAELGTLWPTPNPYPIPNTLYITDGEGYTMAVPIDGSSCFGSACEMRNMDTTSTCGGGLCLPTYSCTDLVGSTGQLPPTDIGVQSTALLWGLQLGDASSMLLRQTHNVMTTADGLKYVAGTGPHACSPADTKQLWRWSRTCAQLASYTSRADTQSSLTVNSVYPLNISFTFAAGTGFGPVPVGAPAIGGEPYTLSATVHE